MQSCVSPLFPTYSPKQILKTDTITFAFKDKRAIAQQSGRYKFNYRRIFMQKLETFLVRLIKMQDTKYFGIKNISIDKHTTSMSITRKKK